MECLDDISDLSSQEIVSNSICAMVTSISICNMDESHVTHICCWQHELESIGFRCSMVWCGAVHEVKKGACGVMWCICEEVYGVVHEIEKIFFNLKKVKFLEDYC